MILSDVQEKLAKSASFQSETICGLFVTLRKSGKQKVCIGDPFETKPLSEAVLHMVRKALLEDDEADEIEISLLTPPRSIDPENLVLGKHGILIMQKQSQALFLPHVPIEKDWDLNTYLEKLCLKAELPIGAWQEGIQAFETQVLTTSLWDSPRTSPQMSKIPASIPNPRS